MAKRNYEKSNAKFAAALTAAVIESGAAKAEHSYEFTLETKAGLLRLSVRPNVASYGAAVFARFDDVERAKGVIGSLLNPFSGKWNHHYFTDDVKPESVAQAVTDIKHCLSSVRA